MPSRMSLFNKEMIKQVGRSVGWISVLYFLGLLFAVPLRIMMTFTDQNFRYFTPIESLFKFDFGLQIILFVSVPVLIAVFLFRFLHVKQAADLMHSMPVKREKIYHFYTITGLLYLIIPVLLIALITSGIHGLYQLDLYF
ncbi:MAG TPA: multidrug ABC transporter permease, partial [Bacillus bacterium]|nr:multidrug ABC transporter permease [Bacillus sp. (in: firmicutes)]